MLHPETRSPLFIAGLSVVLNLVII